MRRSMKMMEVTMMTMWLRTISRSAAYRFKAWLGPDVVDLYPLQVFVEFSLKWHLCKTWSCDHLCMTMCIRVMDDVIWLPALICCAWLIDPWSWMYAYWRSWTASRGPYIALKLFVSSHHLNIDGVMAFMFCFHEGQAGYHFTMFFIMIKQTYYLQCIITHCQLFVFTFHVQHSC